MDKFKAWDKIDKKIKKVRSIDFGANGDANTIRVVDIIFPNVYDFDFDFPERFNDEFELLPYTGVKDDAGREIYEKYIVEIENTYYDTDMVEKFKGLVIWDYTESRYIVEEIGRAGINVLSNPYAHTTSRKIIGNFYENPNLLEEIW